MVTESLTNQHGSVTGKNNLIFPPENTEVMILMLVHLLNITVMGQNRFARICHNSLMVPITGIFRRMNSAVLTGFVAAVADLTTRFEQKIHISIIFMVRITKFVS
jgi:hypothetical protein